MGVGILTVNVGSSSLKLGVFATQPEHTESVIEVTITDIGQPLSRMKVAWGDERSETQQQIAHHEAAVAIGLAELERAQELQHIGGIGVRVVHGGGRYYQPTVIDDEVLTVLQELIPIDPEHMPVILKVIRSFRERLPGVTQVACFDTGFFHEIPQVAQIVPVPAAYREQGLRRYGFHGLSYEYILGEFERVAGETAAHGRVVVAHLGSGASLAVMKDGKPIDMTMGFSPVSGIPMSTRTGDLDPSAVIYLAHLGVGIEDYTQLINKQSGLLGVSGLSADMLLLLDSEGSHAGAHAAVELFCYGVRKAIGSLSAAAGGIDSLIFSGGIGEHAPRIRRRVCEGLAHMGMTLDESRNQQHLERISAEQSRVGVHVIPTDESHILRRSVIEIMEM